MLDEVQLVTGYNLFRRKPEPDLCCAVRHDKPVPIFLETSSWAFEGTVYDDGASPLPVGFKPSAAQEAMATDGYYVFYTAEAPAVGRTRRRHGASATAAGARCVGDG